MKALEAVFEHENTSTRLVRHLAPEAAAEAVLLAHPESYLERIRGAIPETGFAKIEFRHHRQPALMEAARISVPAGAMAAVDAVSGKRPTTPLSRPARLATHAEKIPLWGFACSNQAAIGSTGHARRFTAPSGWQSWIGTFTTAKRHPGHLL